LTIKIVKALNSELHGDDPRWLDEKNTAVADIGYSRLFKIEICNTLVITLIVVKQKKDNRKSLDITIRVH